MLDPKKITVAKIMTSDVVTLQADATLKEALETLADYGISGAPVVDVVGECVGVFTLADLAWRDFEAQEGETPIVLGWYNRGTTAERLRPLPEEREQGEYEREVVGDWMTRDVKAVAPDATVEEAAQVMADQEIHRVVVLDEKRIRGIVSSLDIVKLVAGTRELAAAARSAARTGRAKRPARRAARGTAKKPGRR